VPDSLSLEAVDRQLRGRFGRPYTYVDSCESTQHLLADGAPEGAVAATDHQTAGRGRHGRTWEAPQGTALLCSIVLRPPPERDAPELTLVGAIAAAEAVEGATGLAAQIKWPNDVMLNRRKVCGVLGELRDGVVTLGIGINVNQTREQLPSDAPTPAASLRTITGQTFDRSELLGSLLFRLERLYDEWRRGGLNEVYVEIGPRDFLRGRPVTVDGQSGIATGINCDGRLELDTGHGERVMVEAGEVTYDR
jgi:BirA family biotin operon repressor/biotin-[acetyl-CoA-carboxylase] ligase